MSEISKNLGHATAYGYAKSKGYTGTEAEFAELMASYATTAETAVDAALRAKASEDAAKASETASAASATAAAGSAGTASTAAQTATGAATTATTKASEATTAATTATTKAAEASQSATEAAASATTAGTAATNAQAAQTAAETAQTAAETAQGAAEDAAESVEGKTEQIDQNTEDISLLKSQIDTYCIQNYAGNGPTFDSNYDLNTAPNNTRILWLVSTNKPQSDYPQHWPSDGKVSGRWELYTHTNILNDQSEGYKCQLLLSGNGIWYRSNTGSWSSWSKIGLRVSDLDPYIDTSLGMPLQDSNVYQVNNINTITDLNDLADNTFSMFFYSASYSGQFPSHWPDSGFRGFIIVNNFVTDSVKVQYAISSNGDGYIRYFSDLWTTWKVFAYSASNFESKVKSYLRKTFVLASDGSGDFTSFKTAVQTAMQNADSTIIVRAGTYNLYTEWGGDDWASAYDYSVDGAGLVIGNGLRIICDSKALLTFEYTGNNADLIENFSPLNAGFSDFTIENMRLRAKNCRYAFHDELSGNTTPGIHKFLNCDFYLDDSDNGVWENKPCIGGGLGSDTVIIIDSCRFEAVTDGTDIAGVSYHNASQSGARSSVTITNSYCADHNTFMGTARGNSQEVTPFIVTGCSVYHAPYVGWNYPTQPYENMVLKAWQNEIRSS